MNYANILTGEIRTSLPSFMESAGVVLQGATIADWASKGWRKVTQIAAPSEGYRATAWTPQEIDGTTCRLIVSAQVEIAAESAAQVTATKDAAKVLAEIGATDTGLVLRAICALTLQEINTLRTKAGLANYTAAQFSNALKSKIDAL